jgi:hypothetical protein
MRPSRFLGASLVLIVLASLAPGRAQEQAAAAAGGACERLVRANAAGYSARR